MPLFVPFTVYKSRNGEEIRVQLIQNLILNLFRALNCVESSSGSNSYITGIGAISDSNLESINRSPGEERPENHSSTFDHRESSPVIVENIVFGCCWTQSQVWSQKVMITGDRLNLACGFTVSPNQE